MQEVQEAVFGGMGKGATVMYHCLTKFLSDKWNSSYSLIMDWL